MNSTKSDLITSEGLTGTNALNEEYSLRHSDWSLRVPYVAEDQITNKPVKPSYPLRRLQVRCLRPYWPAQARLVKYRNGQALDRISAYSVVSVSGVDMVTPATPFESRSERSVDIRLQLGLA